eukprot:360329-Chlamydomonas_euryale.AAC.7
MSYIAGKAPLCPMLYVSMSSCHIADVALPYALLYALPETSGLTVQQLQLLVSAHNAYLPGSPAWAQGRMPPSIRQLRCAQWRGCPSPCTSSTLQGSRTSDPRPGCLMGLWLSSRLLLKGWGWDWMVWSAN